MEIKLRNGEAHTRGERGNGAARAIKYNARVSLRFIAQKCYYFTLHQHRLSGGRI